ncbi:MAG: tripartite tricarboxylate transporter TctB family protein [Clostridia bacterium]|nr:tripartite tricarboxylate transporter TctB family protein [Clostridia bacterium]
MKKLNRTYVMGILCLILAAWIFFQTGTITERLVSNEPGPKFFPYICAAGIAIFAILSMVFDGPKESKNGSKPYLDKAGWIRLAIIMGEAVLFLLGMQYLGFWITSMVGMFMFIMTLKGDKKINYVFAILLCVGLGSLCYFGFVNGFHIPLPKGQLWDMLGITMI